MDEVYSLMLQYPMPIIAAMNGYICFPEVDLNIPFVPGLIDVILKAIPQYKFNDMILTGRKLGAEEMAEANFIDRLFDSEDALNDGALFFAKTFNKSRGIFAEHKRRLHQPVLAAIAEKNPPVIEAMKILL